MIFLYSNMYFTIIDINGGFFFSIVRLLKYFYFYFLLITNIIINLMGVDL
jgi:hypothetical protein